MLVEWFSNSGLQRCLERWFKAAVERVRRIKLEVMVVATAVYIGDEVDGVMFIQITEYKETSDRFSSLALNSAQVFLPSFRVNSGRAALLYGNPIDRKLRYTSQLFSVSYT
ncbi:hypothetical protein L1887_04332 [Cichorium endivia]|nr:hypothetical protein L1887_04332 [Cichorium endivia]